MFRLIALATLSLYCSACAERQNPLPDDYQCESPAKVRDLGHNELTTRIDDELIRRLGQANYPNAEGAMGRNVEAYFHVRFQMGLAPLADYVVDQQDEDALEYLLQAIEYSFAHQLPEGDFELQIPADLVDLGPPREGDLASGVAFFASSLGSALIALEESGWFQQNASLQRLEVLEPQMQLTLDYLKSQSETLLQYDQKAPNRLLFDALAYYALGRYLDDKEAQTLGLDFAQRSLVEQHPRGYFIEGGGWDSSYQGVALENGFRLLRMLSAGEAFRDTLYQQLACGTNWQASRILDSGEISLQGNQRVFAGGESFLGKEKGIAVVSTVIALLSLYHYTDQESYYRFAERVV
ncbi:MAG: hypothetical protein AAFQ68_19560, partial [Bacteroidota bacterium]